MRLTKDEARILARALEIAKYEFTKNPDGLLFEKLEELEERLWAFGKDLRRQGRKSHDDFSDVLRRFAKEPGKEHCA